MTGDIYKHRKGGRYLVLLENVRDSNNGSKGTGALSIVYVSLDPGARNGQINVRDASEFHEFVDWPNGLRRPRFEKE